MELSWWALAPTITIALVLAAIVLLRSDERARANVGKRAAEMSLADVIPSVYTALVHTTTWLRNARRPVWLIDYKDLKARVRRMVKVPTPTARADFQARKVTGIRVALYLAIPVVAFAASRDGGDLLSAIMYFGMIYMAFALPISYAHSYLLGIFRSGALLVSIATGMLLGLVLVSIVQYDGLLTPTVIWGGVYGLIVSLVDMLRRAPARIDDERPRTLDEQAKADCL